MKVLLINGSPHPKGNTFIALSEVAKTLEGKVKIVKVDVDQSPELAQKFGVMAVPTMILFKNGKQASAFSGYMPEAQLVARIEAAL